MPTCPARLRAALGALAALSLLDACEPAKATRAGDATPPPDAQTIVVTVSGPPRVAVGTSARFTAAVTGTLDERVSWSVDAGGGTIDPSGVYTAPGSAGDHVVRATSLADRNVWGEAAVRVYLPARVTVSPSPGAVDACRTLQLTATVENVANTAVTWRVQEGAAGGTVSGTGLYTAPATGSTYHVGAVSVADPTAAATTAITVSERVLAVTVSPSSVDLFPGQSTTFHATVQTTCGSTVTATEYTAPR